MNLKCTAFIFCESVYGCQYKKTCVSFPCWVGVDVDQDGVGGDIVVDV